MLVPASAVITMFLGGLLEWIWRLKSAASAVKYSVPVASGLIAGEALVGVILPILYVTKLLTPA